MMGEYAELQWQYEMRRGTYDPLPHAPVKRNPIVRHCPICGKGTRAVGWDKDAGLRAHMKALHKVKLERAGIQ